MSNYVPLYEKIERRSGKETASLIQSALKKVTNSFCKAKGISESYSLEIFLLEGKKEYEIRYSRDVNKLFISIYTPESQLVRAMRSAINPEIFAAMKLVKKIETVETLDYSEDIRFHTYNTLVAEGNGLRVSVPVPKGIPINEMTDLKTKIRRMLEG